MEDISVPAAAIILHVNIYVYIQPHTTYPITFVNKQSAEGLFFANWLFPPRCSHQMEACKLLIEAGADVNCRWSGFSEATLLMVAAIHGSPQLVKTIADHPLVEINAIVS